MNEHSPSDDTDLYRVERSANHPACDACGFGAYWTVVFTEAGEETEVGQAWGDKDTAEDICDLMNMAVDAGREDQQAKVREWLRAHADALNNDAYHALANIVGDP